jgi:hypothetical protein
VAIARQRRVRVKRGRGQGKRGAEVGEVEGDAWERNVAGCGAREAAPAVGGGSRSRAEGAARVTEEEEGIQGQKD